MMRQTCFGMPKRCYNRNCKGQFCQSSHLGWMPRGGTDVYAVMQCPKCNDVFKVVQAISIVHEYYDRLPQSIVKKTEAERPITVKEMSNFRKQLENDPKALSKIFPGHIPGASSSPAHEAQ